MVRSSIADRYLKTLENNSLENAPKSPPKSIHAGSPSRSPLKSPSPLKQTSKPINDSVIHQPKRNSQFKQTASPATSRVAITKTRQSPVRSAHAESPRPLPRPTGSRVVNSSGSPQKVKSSNSSSALTPQPTRLNLGPKPDRNPLMHNQDLTPSQISWDKERKNWQAYEYLCHVVEAKEWMERILGEELAPAEVFPESLQNGVALAKMVKVLRPDLMKWPIFEHKRLQYRHTENITLFFDLLEVLKIPQLFLFDMTDLYEKRNLPKVIYCIHAISHFVAESDFAVSAVDNLVGKLEFSEAQLNTTEQGLKGHAMPNFGAMTRQLSGKQPILEIEDVESEEEAEMETEAKVVEEEEEEPEPELEQEVEEQSDFSEFDNDLVPPNIAKTSRRSHMIANNSSFEEYTDSDDDSVLQLKPPRRYRQRRDISESSSLSSLSSLRIASRELYNGRYSQYDRRQYRGYGYRNLSSAGSLRSRVLSTAELMLKELEELEPEIIVFQGICRGRLCRKKVETMRKDDEKVALAIKLQALCRGALTRKSQLNRRVVLSNENLDSLVNLQAVMRAILVRRTFLTTANKANRITQFQGLARGIVLRRKLMRFDEKLHSKESIKSIVLLQSSFRGVILRFRLSCLYDDLDQHVQGIQGFQARCRGALVRKTETSIRRRWMHNIDKVILLQSVWRAKAQGSRYRTLIADSNPSLDAIKPFLHLIDDKPEDHDRELELETVMKQIGRKVRENEHLEARIDQIDMKISLLLKNNINIDEVVLQHHRQNHLSRQLRDGRYDSESDNMKSNKRGVATTQVGLREQFDPNSLQKASRDRIELYQGLFYVLQTQPAYFSKLMGNKPPKSLDMSHLVLATFGNANTPRENFFLLRQLAHSITQSTVGSPANTIAWSIVSQLNKRHAARNVASEILLPATEKLKASYEKLLEYDPHIIYEHLTGGADLNAEEAIQDPAVRAIFVQNLQCLRELTMSIVQSLASKMTELPYHIKFLAREVYREILRVTGDRKEAMASIGQVVISQFLEPALLSADSLDLVDAAAGNTAKNLVLLSRVLHQVGLMTPFDASGSTDIYLQPLNEFVKSSAHQLSLKFQKVVVESADPSDYYNVSEYDDITMHERPKLTVLVDYLLALHYMCFHNIASVASQDDNLLKPIVERLGPLPKDAREMLDLARFKEIQLELNPKYGSATFSEPSMGSSSLLAKTKQCLGYVLRVQNTYSDVMTALLAPVDFEEEHKYALLLATDNTREAAGELAQLNFKELKRMTLEHIIELESSGNISRNDGYQLLINAIADDIRNKDTLRQKKVLNLESKKRTLEGLEEKGKFLLERLETYNKLINDAMTTLQTEAYESNISKKKRGFHRFQLPTSRSAQNSSLDKNAPRYGQYIASADKLYERGVLIRLRGYDDRQWKDVQFVFSCDKVGEFQMDVSYKGIRLPNGSSLITLDDLLDHQYQSNNQFSIMEDELQLNTNRLLQLIFHRFFGSRER